MRPWELLDSLENGSPPHKRDEDLFLTGGGRVGGGVEIGDLLRV